MVHSGVTRDEVERLHAQLPPGDHVIDAGALVASAATALGAARWDEALALARAALVADPKRARAWAVAGQALAKKELYAEARVACEEGLALDDRDLQLVLLTAQLQARTGAADQARALCSYLVLKSTSAELRAAAERLRRQLDAGGPR